MRVLHSPVDIAGQAGLSAHGLRAIGVQADTWYRPNPLGHGPGAASSSGGPLTRGFDRMRWMLRAATRYDALHFHFGQSFLPAPLQSVELSAYRRLGRRLFVEVWGSEMRMPSRERPLNPWYPENTKADDARAAALAQLWAEHAEGRVLSADRLAALYLRDWFERVEAVPQRVDTRAITPAFPDPATREPLVVHAPSDRGLKGTSHVRAAVEALQAAGVRFRYREVHGVPHPEALRIYREADLIVDQLRLGSHGVFAVEAMAMGKPVVCYIAPAARDGYPPELPVIDANPATIEAVLAEWIGRHGDRHALGMRGRRYAEEVHDTRVVARQLLALYEAR